MRQRVVEMFGRASSTVPNGAEALRITLNTCAAGRAPGARCVRPRSPLLRRIPGLLVIQTEHRLSAYVCRRHFGIGSVFIFFFANLILGATGPLTAELPRVAENDVDFREAGSRKGYRAFLGFDSLRSLNRRSGDQAPQRHGRSIVRIVCAFLGLLPGESPKKAQMNAPTGNRPPITRIAGNNGPNPRGKTKTGPDQQLIRTRLRESTRPDFIIEPSWGYRQKRVDGNLI